VCTSLLGLRRSPGEAREIFISQDALDEAGDVAVSEAQEVGIKGVSTPLKVASITW